MLPIHPPQKRAEGAKFKHYESIDLAASLCVTDELMTPHKIIIQIAYYRPAANSKMICRQSLPPSPVSTISSSSADPSSRSKTSIPLLISCLEFNQICIFALIPPLTGILAICVLALWLHSSLLFGYEWTCGIAFLPSVSRVLNLPTERIIWNFVICLHIPLRFVITFYYYHFSFRSSFPSKSGRRIRQQNASDNCGQSNGLKNDFGYNKSSNGFSFVEKYLRIVFLVSGIADQIFLLCLSVVGERESAELHVVFFSAFLFSTFVHFNTHFYLEDYTGLLTHHDLDAEFSHWAKKVRMVLLVSFWLLVPFIVICFTLHELYCTNFSYEFFVLGEYLTIAVIFGFNSAVILDKHSNSNIGLTLFIKNNK